MFLTREKSDRYTAAFNAVDNELYREAVDNAAAADFLAENIPQFDCPDPMIEEIYYFRWWSFRKHLRKTPYGYVFLEFMPDVTWAGSFNTISCPAEHHVSEARWLRHACYVEDYLRFWFKSEAGASPRRYTFAAATAAVKVAQATGHWDVATALLPQLEANVAGWETEKGRPNGMFYQIDDRDGMECSVGGSGIRTIINSVMVSEYRSLGLLARRLGGAEMLKRAEAYDRRANDLQQQLETLLWNPAAEFFETRTDNDAFEFVNVRELHGLTPWFYHLAMDPKFDVAWKQFMDPQGFYAPFGPTTAEQRHPGFCISREGHKCQWNGPSWPFATTVVLGALANLLHDHKTLAISRQDWFTVFRNYFNSHYLTEDNHRVPWIDENLDPFTGEWLSRSLLKDTSRYVERGKDYAHSAALDLVITQLCGLRPEEDGIVLDPMLPKGYWRYFCLDGVPFRGHDLTIQYDVDGSRYGRGTGLKVFVDGVDTPYKLGATCNY